MFTTNLLPAVLLAGPPHCGKSVLAYMLTFGLRERGISHYLLRAAPDGEGDWFLRGEPNAVRELRLQYKRDFSAQFVRHMTAAVANRALPLLVDVGGKPRGAQLNILAACSHSILLYRTEEQLLEWRAMLQGLGLQAVAELRSELTGPERLDGFSPLRGTIGGLDRDASARCSGEMLERLLELTAGILQYSEAQLEQVQCARAPLPVMNERQVAENLGVQCTAGRLVWHAEDLDRLGPWVPAGKPLAIYGRGTVWLAAWLAARALPAEAAIFDARFGWLRVPRAARRSPASLRVQASPVRGGLRLDFDLLDAVLEPGELRLPPWPDEPGGVLLSGKLPRWAFAALARYFARRKPWVAVWDAALGAAVTVWGQMG